MVSEEVGLLVPPNDPKALGAAMAQLATDAELRKSMGTAARRKYEELFTPAAVVPLLIDFYKRVIDAPETAVMATLNRDIRGSISMRSSHDVFFAPERHCLLRQADNQMKLLQAI